LAEKNPAPLINPDTEVAILKILQEYTASSVLSHIAHIGRIDEKKRMYSVENLHPVTEESLSRMSETAIRGLMADMEDAKEELQALGILLLHWSLDSIGRQLRSYPDEPEFYKVDNFSEAGLLSLENPGGEWEAAPVEFTGNNPKSAYTRAVAKLEGRVNKLTELDDIMFKDLKTMLERAADAAKANGR
jgi:hypothetical protein